jgi:hypothetical protein
MIYTEKEIEMNNDDYLTVAAFQGSINEGNYEANLKKVLVLHELLG